MILVSDIGGTKTILALFDSAGDGNKYLKKEQSPSTHYPTFAELLTAFLADVGCIHMKAACIGVAGAIANDCCETTNLPWIVNSKKNGKHINSQNGCILNDLEATAQGLLGLPESSFVE